MEQKLQMSIQQNFGTEKVYLFRDALLKLFTMRSKAKKDGLLAFAEALKIVMNGGGGKLGQALIDIIHVIIDIENYEELNEYYQKGQVCFHELLANGKQYLAEIQKSRLPKVEIPSHLYAFILSYGRHHVNLFLMRLEVLMNGRKRLHTLTPILHSFITSNINISIRLNYQTILNSWMKVS